MIIKLQLIKKEEMSKIGVKHWAKHLRRRTHKIVYRAKYNLLLDTNAVYNKQTLCDWLISTGSLDNGTYQLRRFTNKKIIKKSKYVYNKTVAEFIKTENKIRLINIRWFRKQDWWEK